jgi:hypothetical protein
MNYDLSNTINGLLGYHANISLPNRSINHKLYFISPNMHKVHHHWKQPYTDTNYGGSLRSGTGYSELLKHLIQKVFAMVLTVIIPMKRRGPYCVTKNHFKT